jgi:uncharacterized membrane protein
METRMKNKWLAAALNIVPGLGYLYAGVRTPFAILLLAVWPLSFASAWVTPMEDIETLNSVAYNPWDFLMYAAIIAGFTIDAYFEAIRINGPQAKPAKTKKK